MQSRDAVHNLWRVSARAHLRENIRDSRSLHNADAAGTQVGIIATCSPTMMFARTLTYLIALSSSQERSGIKRYASCRCARARAHVTAYFQGDKWSE